MQNTGVPSTQYKVGRGIAFALSAGVLVAQCCTALAAEPAVSAGGVTLTSKGLVGVGRIPANQRDKFGETFGSGSGMAIDTSSWRRNGETYSGTLWLLPDRGYNVEGTTDYRARLNRLSITFTPVAPDAAPPPDNRQSAVNAHLEDSIMLTEASGTPLTGLDPGDGVRPATAAWPALPQTENGRISLDAEAVVRLPDGTFLISDEYGPHIYHFATDGKLLAATAPPQAYRPMRQGHLNFSSNNPGPGAKPPVPKDPDTGRQNNQGFEGMTLTPRGRLVTLLQSATRQDGGDKAETRRFTRALVWDAHDPSTLKLTAEHVVPLPVFTDAKGATRVAAQSEALAISDTLFLLLCRDSSNGYGQKGDTSRYRRIELMDLAGASNIAGGDYDGLKPVAPSGRLVDGITPATLASFIDLNDTSELARFGLHNGPPNDRNNLSEKWEAMALVSALDPAAPDDWFLIVANDNDFATQDGFQVGAPYKDASGADVDTMLLVYRIRIEGAAKGQPK